MSDDSQVREQYEAYPYPERDPQDEARRLVTGSPSHLLEVNHYVFGGRRDFGRPFRALVAGGGTGDAAIMLAQQLTDAGDAGEVVYVDASEAARRVAEQRASRMYFTSWRRTAPKRLSPDPSPRRYPTFEILTAARSQNHSNPEAQ